MSRRVTVGATSRTPLQHHGRENRWRDSRSGNSLVGRKQALPELSLSGQCLSCLWFATASTEIELPGRISYVFLKDFLWQIVMENRLVCRDGSVGRGLANEFGWAVAAGPMLPMTHGCMAQAITIECAKEVSLTAFMDRIPMVFHNGLLWRLAWLFIYEPWGLSFSHTVAFPLRVESAQTPSSMISFLQDTVERGNGANTVYLAWKTCISGKPPDQLGIRLREAVRMSAGEKGGRGLDFSFQI